MQTIQVCGINNRFESKFFNISLVPVCDLNIYDIDSLKRKYVFVKPQRKNLDLFHKLITFKP